MTNDFIAMLKDSSLVSLVTLTELTKTYTSSRNRPAITSVGVWGALVPGHRPSFDRVARLDESDSQKTGAAAA